MTKSVKSSITRADLRRKLESMQESPKEMKKMKEADRVKTFVSDR